MLSEEAKVEAEVAHLDERIGKLVDDMEASFMEEYRSNFVSSYDCTREIFGEFLKKWMQVLDAFRKAEWIDAGTHVPNAIVYITYDIARSRGVDDGWPPEPEGPFNAADAFAALDTLRSWNASVPDPEAL